MKVISRQIYWCDFHIFKLNDLIKSYSWFIFPMFDSNLVQNDF
jgi:hypothetical protein